MAGGGGKEYLRVKEVIIVMNDDTLWCKKNEFKSVWIGS